MLKMFVRNIKKSQKSKWTQIAKCYFSFLDFDFLFCITGIWYERDKLIGSIIKLFVITNKIRQLCFPSFKIQQIIQLL